MLSLFFVVCQPPSLDEGDSRGHGRGATALDGLHLGEGPRQLGELERQLRAVKVLAAGGLDGTQGGARRLADAGDGARAVQGPVLLGLLAVLGEGGGEGVGGRGRVGLGRAVDLCGRVSGETEGGEGATDWLRGTACPGT
jgi:hypothetical protein